MTYFKKKINRFTRWNRWRKHNRNGKFFKLLVLLGMNTPTFLLTLSDAEEKAVDEAIKERIREIKNRCNGCTHDCSTCAIALFRELRDAK